MKVTYHKSVIRFGSFRAGFRLDDLEEPVRNFVDEMRVLKYHHLHHIPPSECYSFVLVLTSEEETNLNPEQWATLQLLVDGINISQMLRASDYKRLR